MKKITSEEPIDHWGFLKVKDKIVLDLGCGKFHSTISTPEWFIQNGAQKVIGIDLSSEFEYDKFIYHAMAIENSQQIKGLIETYKPHIIKADIEGAEIHFNNVEISDLGVVSEIAIEYHSNELMELIFNKLADWDFALLDIYQLFDIETERMGVIHAVKM
jgi:SAM-dependent methyltransferase